MGFVPDFFHDVGEFVTRGLFVEDGVWVGRGEAAGVLDGNDVIVEAVIEESGLREGGFGGILEAICNQAKADALHGAGGVVRDFEKTGVPPLGEERLAEAELPAFGKAKGGREEK